MIFLFFEGGGGATWVRLSALLGDKAGLSPTPENLGTLDDLQWRSSKFPGRQPCLLHRDWLDWDWLNAEKNFPEKKTGIVIGCDQYGKGSRVLRQ